MSMQKILVSMTAAAAFAVSAPGLAQSAAGGAGVSVGGSAGGGVGIGIGGTGGGIGVGGSGGAGVGGSIGAGTGMGGLGGIGDIGASARSGASGHGAANVANRGGSANWGSAINMRASTSTSRSQARLSSQGSASASATGIANANENSVLSVAANGGSLASLTVGMTVVDGAGATIGTVNRIVTSADGKVRMVLVASANGRGMIRMTPAQLSVNGSLATTTMAMASRSRR